MLILTRRTGQSVIIQLDPNIDPETPIKEFFSKEPLRLTVTHVNGNQVKVGIAAHPGLTILREELCS
jgi:sRNA-binding carbon storage regulator CsrA